jgi:hypothetical protein
VVWGGLALRGLRRALDGSGGLGLRGLTGPLGICNPLGLVIFLVIFDNLSYFSAA